MMKRVRDFIVVRNEGDVSKSLRKTAKTKRSRQNSWHDLRKNCKESLQNGEFEPVLVFDTTTKQIVASISSQDEQLQQRSHQNEDGEIIVTLPKWESYSLGRIEAQDLFLNCNATDFEWHLLEGGKYESPFRLSYLERIAERNPDGFIARWARSIHAWRDMLSPGRVA